MSIGKLVSLHRCENCSAIGDEGEEGYSFPVCYRNPSLGNLKSFPFKKKMKCFSHDPYRFGLNNMPLPSKHPNNEFMRWLLEWRHVMKWQELVSYDCLPIEFNKQVKEIEG